MILLSQLARGPHLCAGEDFAPDPWEDRYWRVSWLTFPTPAMSSMTGLAWWLDDLELDWCALEGVEERREDPVLPTGVDETAFEAWEDKVANNNQFRLTTEVVRPLISKSRLVRPALRGLREITDSDVWSMGSIFVFSRQSK